MRKTETGMPILNREELNKFIERWKLVAPRKPILLMGKPGIGKTTILKNLVEYDECISANQLVVRYMQNGMESLSMHGRIWITQKLVDDIGTEVTASHFGNKVNLLQLLILHWYEENQPKHMTTNLNLKELEEKYGQRVISRLKQTHYIIVLDDTDFRQMPDDIFYEVEEKLKKQDELAEKKRRQEEEDRAERRRQVEEDQRKWDEKQKQITELELTMANPGQQDG